jgi:hypothetical protein
MTQPDVKNQTARDICFSGQPIIQRYESGTFVGD